MRTATAFNLAVSGAYEMLLVMFPASMPYLIKLGTSVGTKEHTGEHRHFTHRCKPSATITNSLNDIEGFLVDDGFMAVLENLPVFWVILLNLLILVGFSVGFEIYQMP